MSSHRRRVVLSPRASLDYADILLDSLAKWGEEQARRYQADLDRALDELGEYPEIGPARQDLPRGYRGRLVGQHAIFYRIETETIDVKRILHGRRDPRRTELE